MNTYNLTIPTVNQIDNFRNVSIEIPKTISISAAFDMHSVNVFTDWLKKLGYKYEIKEGFLFLECLKTLGSEAYKLTILEDKIVIHASNRIGQLRAMATLFQMIASNNVCVGEYYDEPVYQYRSFSLDVSRHFFDCDEVKKLINQAALLKLNHFHFHVSDDRGYRLPSKKFPLLNKVGSARIEADGLINKAYYTEEEIHEIVGYANDRGIEIIPEIDMPGHSLAIIASYPETSCSGNKRAVSIAGGIEKQILCGGNKEVRSFLKELLDEVLELFPGSMIHLGGDEAPKDEWNNCPVCKEYIKENNLANTEELQADLLNEMSAYLAKKGRKAICWNDACVSGKLDKDIIIQYWDELHPNPSMLAEVKNGRKIILSNIQKFYADYGYGLLPLQATYEYEPQMLLQKDLPMNNILGIETTMWTEWIIKPEELESKLYPRLVASAEAGWSKNRDYKDFTDRLKNYEKILDIFEIAYDKAGTCLQTDEEKANEIIDDALRMHMIDPSTMTSDTAIARLNGWLQYLQGDYILESVRNKVFENIESLFKK